MDTTMRMDSGLEQHVVSCECCPHGLRRRFPQRSAALHIGEEERHRHETLKIMGQIAARYDYVTFCQTCLRHIQAFRFGRS